jgi:hypothetical protein
VVAHFGDEVGGLEVGAGAEGLDLGDWVADIR